MHELCDSQSTLAEPSNDNSSDQDDCSTISYSAYQHVSRGSPSQLRLRKRSVKIASPVAKLKGRGWVRGYSGSLAGYQ